ncbi:protein translocase subunit SecD [Roseomonas elaeocarpi]
MLYFARWKVAAILGVILLGILVCLPNILPRNVLPAWASRQISLGLDLRGGSYLLLEVDLNRVAHDRLEALADGARSRLRQNGIAFSGIATDEPARRVNIRLADPAQAEAAATQLRELSNPVTAASGATTPDIDVAANNGVVTVTVTEAGLQSRASGAVEQSVEIVRRRVDETGVAESIVARQGADRVLVQLPGVDDPNRIKQLLGQTAKMTFHLLDENASLGAANPPPGDMFLVGERDGQRYAVRRQVAVDGANLSDARASRDGQTGEWVVSFTFDSAGTRRFADITRANVGHPFAIVLDDKVLTAPVIREPITGGRGQISGSFNAQSASDLAVLLRAGALPAPLTVVEERTVGPELGADAIRAGLIALGTGTVLVLLYMGTAYGLFGWFANLALLINLVLTGAALTLLGATLTLPGIAGIVLTLGTAVDANILINERIREEQQAGRNPVAALEAGFSKAYGTILDSNITNLIAIACLYVFGSGPVKGFAVTVALGTVVHLFTATTLVRWMISVWFRRRRPRVLPV